MNPIYPYPTLRTSLDLTVTSLEIDGQKADDEILRSHHQMIDLHQHYLDGWKAAKFSMEVVAQPEVVERFEKDHDELIVSLSLNCRPTNARRSLVLTKSATEPGKWHGEIETQREFFGGRVDLSASAATTVEGVPFRLVGKSDPWWLFFDEPTTVKIGGALKVVWSDFKGEGAPMVARQFPDATHVVDLDGPLPIVYLNQSFEGLHALLKDKKDRSTVELALHDAHRYSIARSVWMTLLMDSLAAVRTEEDETEAEWPNKEWQREVLRRLLPKIVPHKTDQELLNMAAEDWQSGTGLATFLPRAEAAIGEFIDCNSALRKSLHKLNREGVFNVQNNEVA